MPAQTTAEPGASASAGPPTDLYQPAGDPGLDRLTQLAVRVLHADQGLICVLDGDRLVVQSGHGLPEADGGCAPIVAAGSFTEHVVATGESLVLTDARQSPRWRESPSVRLLGGAGCLGVPLVIEGERVGAFVVLSPTPRAWSAGEVETLTDLAQAAAAQVRLHVEVTRHRLALEALRRREAHFQAVFSQAAVGLVLLDNEGRIQSANPAFARIVEETVDALRGRHWRTLVHPDDVEADARSLSLVNDGQADGYELEKRYLLPDGRVVWVQVETTVVRDEQGRPDGVFRIVRDISEHKRLTEQFLQAQKMEAIGKLAGGVAHDFNNLLAVIHGYSELLLDGLPVESGARGSLTQIQKAALRAADLTHQMLAFSRRELLAPRPLDLNAVVEDTEKMLRRLIGEDVTLETCLGADLPPVMADPGQVMQVLMNLAVNARDAMPEGGCLTIGTRAAELGPADEQVEDGLAPGPYVRLSVADTGHGMPEAVRRQVFEPFYTTKAAGRGTGLGLSTVYDIVVQAGGRISVASEVDQGTVFHIHLPAVAEAPTAVAGTARPAERPRGSETILVVEDDPSVRRIVSSLLTSVGYHVLQAERPEQAVELSRQHAGAIDLLLSDVVLPGLNGPDLAHLLTGERPEMRVLFMSGYDGEPTAAAALDGLTPLRKPFSHRKLAEAVRQCLDQGLSEPVAY